MTSDSEHAGAQWQIEILGYYKNIPLVDSKVNDISMSSYFMPCLLSMLFNEIELREGYLMKSDLMRMRVRLRAKCHICGNKELLILIRK
jgi:hypothetical protein